MSAPTVTRRPTTGPARSSPARSSKGEATRARILALARRVLINDGYDAFVMRDIATQAQMKLGNLQYYFPTRDSLIEAVIQEEARTDLDDLRAFRESNRDGIVELASLVKFLIRKWRGDSGKVLSIMGFLALHHESFRGTYTEVYEQFYEALGAVIESVDPGLKPATYIGRARLITALIDGAAMQVRRGTAPEFFDYVARHALWIACPEMDSAKEQM